MDKTDPKKMDKAAALQLNPVVLAFLGDAVYTLYVREKCVERCDGKAAELHRMAADEVNAGAQSALALRLIPRLTEEEAAVYRRARNAHKGTRAKHSTVADYNRSTGFEAVLGFLYVTGDDRRIRELLEGGEDEP